MKSKDMSSAPALSEPRAAKAGPTFRSEPTTSTTGTPENPKTGRKAALKPDEAGSFPT